MRLTKILMLMLATGATVACRFDDYTVEFDYTSVYFANQQYIHNVVVGEGLAFEPGVIFSGVISNNSTRSVGYMIDESLLPASATLLPADYYTVDNSSSIVIPKGKMKGYVRLTLDSLKLMNDPQSLTGFVLPLRLTELDGIDRITEDKGTMVLTISYFAKQEANYTYSGTSDKTDASGTVRTTYANNPSQNNSFRFLKTVGPDVMRVESDKAPNGDPALGSTTFFVKAPVHGGGVVEISTDPDCPVVVEPDGESTYDEDTRTFILRYKYTSDGADYKVVDELRFRNRIRDYNGESDYLNEWMY